ncbi:hypothetical protein FOL47_005598 [Perkinsus chesapeaki]|uniref:DNA repair protein rad16 n=1 Tax=Perkinsus chesapeaki TaxID=330153 RepID=A0A7J6LXJ2_PERCH|nr:hypothetical protein FOL47_005598 [Perkinsus chesapeaki]
MYSSPSSPGTAARENDALHAGALKSEVDIGFSYVPPELLHRFPPPSELRVELLPYQREGLAWMCNQETLPQRRGGILADEMGMGKTIQFLSMLAVRKPETKGPTLIIAPLATLHQWVSEVHKYFGTEFLKIYLYHGNHKITAPELIQYDIVLTTPQTLECEFRAEVNELKVRCKFCARCYLPELLEAHKNACGHNRDGDARTGRGGDPRDYDFNEADVLDAFFGDDASTPRPSTPSCSRPSTDTRSRFEDFIFGGDWYGTPSDYPSHSPIPELKRGATFINYYDQSPRRCSSTGNEQAHWNTAVSTAADVKKDSYDGVKTGAEDNHHCWRTGHVKEDNAFLKEEACRVKPEANYGGVSWRNRFDHLGSSHVATSMKHEKTEPFCKTESDRWAAERSSRDPEVISISSDDSRPLKEEEDEVIDLDDDVMSLAGSLKSEMTVIDAELVSDVSSPVEKAEFKEECKVDEPAAPKSESSSSGVNPPTPQHGEPTTPEVNRRVKIIGSKTSEGTPARKRRGTPGGSAKKRCRDSTTTPGEPWRQPQDTYDAEDDIGCERPDLDARLRNNMLLHSLVWSRVCLDEAHRIRNKGNSTTKACLALRCRYRWCLTGTPIQNKIGDIYSLARFLRVRPLSTICCDTPDCRCNVLEYPWEERCHSCDHPRASHCYYFNRFIANPIRRSGLNSQEGSEGLRMLRSQLLRKFLLRRTKSQRESDVKLPPMEERPTAAVMSGEEAAYYQAKYELYRNRIRKYAKDGQLANRMVEALKMILRLRQAANHRYLIEFSPQKSFFCGICHDEIPQRTACAGQALARAVCDHLFHNSCVKSWLRNADARCPCCQQALDVRYGNVFSSPDDADDDAEENVEFEYLRRLQGDPRLPRKTSILKKIPITAFESSSKVEALVAGVQDMRSADGQAKGVNRPYRPVLLTIYFYLSTSPKVAHFNGSFAQRRLVFSCFVSLLEICQYRLKQAGIDTLILHGELTLPLRSKVMKTFTESSADTCPLLLISLMSGGEGLNLQVANYIYLLGETSLYRVTERQSEFDGVSDPWWNPAVEQQATQRAHRLGQTKPVEVIKMTTGGTIEERIVTLQEKKRAICRGIIDGDGSLEGLSLEDIRFLFQL